MDKEQTEVDVKLQLRVGDVEFWKGELDNKLAQIKEEIEEAVGAVLTLLKIPKPLATSKDNRDGELET